MKKAISTIRLVAVALTILFSAGVASATGSAPKNVAYTVNIHYVGIWQNLPVFQVYLANPEEDEITITIRDLDQNVIHNETLTGKFVSRKYGIDLMGHDLNNIRIVVTSKRASSTQVYQIVNTTRMQEDVSVERL